MHWRSKSKSLQEIRPTLKLETHALKMAGFDGDIDRAIRQDIAILMTGLISPCANVQPELLLIENVGNITLRFFILLNYPPYTFCLLFYKRVHGTHLKYWIFQQVSTVWWQLVETIQTNVVPNQGNIHALAKQ